MHFKCMLANTALLGCPGFPRCRQCEEVWEQNSCQPPKCRAVLLLNLSLLLPLKDSLFSAIPPVTSSERRLYNSRPQHFHEASQCRTYL